MVRIRMQRFGRRHIAFYRINAIEKTTKRDGKVLENLGWYNPAAKDKAKQIELNEERVKYWIARGAQPSDTMMDVLSKRSLVDAAAWGKVRTARAEASKARAAALAAAPAAGEKKAEAKPEAKAEAKAEAKKE